MSKEVIAKLGGRRPFWVHGVSVGEVQAVIPLVRAAREAGYTGPIIISTTTETGKAMALRLGSGLFDAHIYYPWDKKKFVRSAIKSLNPWAFAAAETEMWPNMLWEMRDAGVKTFLVNGRISDRTWVRLDGVVKRKIGSVLYGLFTKIFLRDQLDANRLESIGLPLEKMNVFGDSKVDALLSRKDPVACQDWINKLGLGDSHLFVAGSTHEGEEEEILKAFETVRISEPNIRLIIAPRHPERASEVKVFSSVKFRTYLLSEFLEDWDVIVVDRIGVLFELYGAAAAAFVGGSLVDKGGQNIMEPASWGVPVQYGPHMEDFAEASKELLSIGLASQVEDGKQLAEIWTEIACKSKSKSEGRCGDLSVKYFTDMSGAAARTWAEISKYCRLD